MNLELQAYVKENPTKTLSQVQIVEKIKQKKLSADLMRSFLNKPDVQLYSYFKDAVTSATKTQVGADFYNIGDLKVTTFDNMASAGEFNFITGHPSYQGGLLDVLIFAETNVDLKASLNALKVHCMNYCNVVTKPFSAATQVEFDTAKASAVLNVPTDAHTVVYGETQLDYMIKLPNQDIKFFVVFDAAPPEDAVVDVFVLEQPTDALPHAVTGKTNIIRTKTGDVTTADTLTKNYKRKIKFKATSNKNFPFTLHVNNG